MDFAPSLMRLRLRLCVCRAIKVLSPRDDLRFRVISRRKHVEIMLEDRGRAEGEPS
jgi:hypothetical protein